MEIVKFNNLARRFKSIESEYRQREDYIYKSGIFFEGEQTNEFIEKLKEFTNYEYVVLTSSGTAALFIMGIYYKKWFSKIVTTPYTYIATHNAFKRAGYELFMTNIDKYMLGTFDDDKFDNSYLYVPVGIYGKQPHIPSNVTVLEDACQNWINSKTTHSKAASFDTTKNISSNGNGGAIFTNDKDLWEFARKFIMIDVNEVGLNLRISELECAYLIPQLENIHKTQERRTNIAKIYNSIFRDKAIYEGEPDHDLQKYIIRKEELNHDNSIEVRNFYKNTGLGSDLLGIPLYPELTDQEIMQVVKSFKKH